MAQIAKAIAKGDTDALSKALSNADDVNAEIKNGQTGLTLAILSEDTEMVETFLTSKHVDVNVPNAEGLTPLMLAICTEASTLLLKHRKINLAGRDKAGQYAVHHAARSESQWAIKFLSEVPAEYLDMRTSKMKSALHVAAEDGNMPAIDALLQRKVDINAQDEEGHTSLVKAVLNSSTAIAIRLLQSSADPKVLTKDGSTALHYACNRDCSELLRQKLQESGLTLNMTNLAGETPQQFLDERAKQKRMEENLAQEKRQHAAEEKTIRKRTKQQEAIANSSLIPLLEENNLGHLADWLTSRRYMCVDDLRDLTFEKLKKAKVGKIEERFRLLNLVVQEDAKRAQLEKELEENRLAAIENEKKRKKRMTWVFMIGSVAVLWCIIELLIYLKKWRK